MRLHSYQSVWVGAGPNELGNDHGLLARIPNWRARPTIDSIMKRLRTTPVLRTNVRAPCDQLLYNAGLFCSRPHMQRGITLGDVVLDPIKKFSFATCRVAPLCVRWGEKRARAARPKAEATPHATLAAGPRGFYVVSLRSASADMASPYRIERDRGAKHASNLRCSGEMAAAPAGWASLEPGSRFGDLPPAKKDQPHLMRGRQRGLRALFGRRPRNTGVAAGPGSREGEPVSPVRRRNRGPT
jgi:hypothetical protein